MKKVFALTEYFQNLRYTCLRGLPSFVGLEYLYDLIMGLVLGDGDRHSTENKSKFYSHNDIHYDCS